MKAKAKAKVSLPVITGTVSVSFKHEGESRGMAFGPVVVIAVETNKAWLEEHGTPLAGKYGVIWSYPFGATPEGQFDLGWMTKRDALKVAAHYGVVLGEA